MQIDFSNDVEKVSWIELARLIELAPLGTRDPHELERAFRNSPVRWFAYEGGRLVGAGRALSDGVWRAAVYDVVVLPEYQGRGVGREVMRRIIADAGVEMIMLYAAAGKEEFYRKLGFDKMTTSMALVSDPNSYRARGLIE